MTSFIDAHKNAQLLAELRDALTELSMNLKDLQAIVDFQTGGPISVMARQELEIAIGILESSSTPKPDAANS